MTIAITAKPDCYSSNSAAESTAPAILIPSSHKQTQKCDGDQTQNDAAQKGFDHESR